MKNSRVWLGLKVSMKWSCVAMAANNLLSKKDIREAQKTAVEQLRCTLRFVLLVPFLLCLTLPAHAEYLVGYFNHPQIELYKHVVRSAYKDIGVDITFLEVTMERGLMALDNGLLDADVIRAVHAEKDFSNIVLIEPVLTVAQTHLLCTPDSQCDRSILYDTNNDVYINIAATLVIDDYLDKPATANFIAMEKVDTMLSMFLGGRINYVVYHSDGSGLPPLIDEKFTSMYLGEFKTYHVIHKKHGHLAPQLTKAIEQRLANFVPTNAVDTNDSNSSN